MDHDDYQAVNLGQLKSIVKVHYDKLMDLGCITGYPWLEGLNGNSNHSEPDDYYVANIGQLKNLFSFDLKYFFNTSKLDSDSNSLPDSWELRYFGTIGVDPHADPNGNGVENITEYREGTDPTLNFYEGVKPIIQIIESGYGQKAIAGEFLINPLRVRILKPSDMSPWPNAPVRFSATPSEGLLSIQPDALSLLKPSINVKTDADGYAQVWLKCP
jgi:hypothetical protein